MNNSNVIGSLALINGILDRSMDSAKGGVFTNNRMKEVIRMSTKPTIKVEGKFADYVRELDYRNIGPDVCVGDIQEEILSDISAVCRRAFKKKDVIVYVGIDPEDDYEEGIVFTTDSIFCWTDNGANVTGIKYSEIKKIDYDETDILIEHDNTTTRFSLGDDAEEEKYPRHMYSFIMDILDYEDPEDPDERVNS